MKKQLLLFFVLLLTVTINAQTITVSSAPTSAEPGEEITVSVSFDTGGAAATDIYYELRELSGSSGGLGTWKTGTLKDISDAVSGTDSWTVTLPGDLDPVKNYDIVVNYKIGAAWGPGGFQAIDITEPAVAAISYSSLPTEVSSKVGGGLGKGALKTVVTWTNVTPGGTLFNQLRDHTGTQVGGKGIAIGTANGSAEIEWGYFGGGTLVAGNVANIYSQYTGVANIQQASIPVVNTITRWYAGIDSDWATSGNWDNGVPTASLKAVIPNIATKPVITASADALNVTVQDGSSITMNAGSSLIVDGETSGDITYNRSVNFVSGNLKGWYLMASPVVGQAYNDTYVTANDIAVNGTNRGIATYNTSGNTWSYLQGGASDSFISGQGYSVKRQTNTGTVSFTGTLNTNDAGVDYLLSTVDDGFNLLGNPYASYISSATLLGNAALSDTQTIWIYNETLGTNGDYEVKTYGDDFIIAPGQGFFVKANSAGGTVNFAEANQSHNADTFQKSSKTAVKLQISVDGFNNYAKLYYLENANKGFDVGYEGESFGAYNDSFSIYTELLTDNEGKKYQVQSLPNSDFESMIIPVGVKAAAGKEITFSADALNLPSGVKVFLEDKITNTFTRLDEVNTTYKVTLSEALDGVGRFYLHTKSSALSTTDVLLDNISIYKTNNYNLRVVGLHQGNADVKIYNIIGKQVLSTSFKANGSNNVSLPNLTTGVYVIQLTTEAGKLNKKIILE